MGPLPQESPSPLASTKPRKPESFRPPAVTRHHQLSFLNLDDLAREYAVFVASTADQGDFPKNARTLENYFFTATTQGERPPAKSKFDFFVWETATTDIDSKTRTTITSRERISTPSWKPLERRDSYSLGLETTRTPTDPRSDTKFGSQSCGRH